MSEATDIYAPTAESAVEAPPSPEAPAPKPGKRRRLGRMLLFVAKLLVGGFLCQFAVSAVLVVGWTYRYMQRTALKQWWKASEKKPDLATFVDQWAGRTGSGIRNWPVVGALWRNTVLGVQAIVNVWVLTLLPSLLWTFGWYSGWNNSFHKGYEQFSNGVIISWTGIFLFLLVMLYLPMALTRQAVTGEWRSFYQFRTVWTVIKRRRTACLLLAGVFSLASLPVTLLKMVPAFSGEEGSAFVTMSGPEILHWLNTYFFWSSVFGFAAFVFVRWVAARIYASGVLAALRAGTLTQRDLGTFERDALHDLALLDHDAPTRLHPVLAIAGKATRPPWRATITVATLVIWFSFVAQIYVSEFFNYHPQRGFLNQPLIQLPWFRYVPKHLTQEASWEVRDNAPEF